MPLRLPENLPAEPCHIQQFTAPDGNYELRLPPAFPFAIKHFSYASTLQGFPLNWHERLELFVPLEGRGRFRMGERSWYFSPGDIIVVDVKSLHGLLEFSGQDPRALVITFLPELICTLGSLACDSQYLTPFYCQNDTVEPILRHNERLAPPVHGAIRKLVDCHFGAAGGQQFETGCKVYLLEVLYFLSLHFGFSQQAQALVREQRRLVERLAKLHEWLRDHYAERISVADAAGICAMSETQFMKLFKKATGSTFVHYLTRLRLSQAARLLRDTDLPIGQIAAQVGFCDQSYFDRKFKDHFHATPNESRRAPIQ
jgi:AraC-like DNA-binding protein/mannose-6-phosphate isomerase-like protein (cupin superfamily)